MLCVFLGFISSYVWLICNFLSFVLPRTVLLNRWVYILQCTSYQVITCQINKKKSWPLSIFMKFGTHSIDFLKQNFTHFSGLPLS